MLVQPASSGKALRLAPPRLRSGVLLGPGFRVDSYTPRTSWHLHSGLFERSGRKHQGRALETAVLLELERRGFDVAYVRTSEGFEVDFLARRAGEAPLLLQVCLESEGDETWERELRALESAFAALPEVRPLLLTLDAVPPTRPMPEGLAWAPAAQWLLEEM